VVDETLTPGLFISGRFRLKRLLGRGGMGSVWAAHHLTLEKDVAIKFLEPKWASSEDARRRFAQEAIAVARMKSPHVVSVLDFGFTEENRAFIVMELLHGEDLGQRLARVSRLSLEETREIIAQTCRGLEKSHSLDVVHRDLKPENLFLSDEDGLVVKLLDFGVAKAVGMGAGGHITDTGQIVGTPLYMSPEQALGRLIDTRSDLYSLAVIAYRCLSGRLPFVDKPAGELIVALSTLTPPAPSGFVAGLPESLDRWFASMFRKDPDARCAQSASTLSATFATACDGGFYDPLNEAQLGALAKATAPTLIAKPELPLQPRSANGVELQAHAHPDARPTLRRLAPLALLVLVLSVLLWQYGPSTPRAVPAADLVEQKSPPVVEAPRQVLLGVQVSPANASIYLDGVLLGGNPFTAARPADASPHRLRVEAPGHVPIEREIRLERDLQVELLMSPTPAPERTSAHKPPPPPRPHVESRASRSAAPEPAAAEPATPLPAPQSQPESPPAEPRKRRPLELDRTPPWRSP
jgi:hypothetical protein